MIVQFLPMLKHYIIEILPALAIGFFLSGLIHEFIPTIWVERHLGEKGFRPIFYSTLVGTLLPICCWGALPVAVSFYKKGAKLGPVLAFLVATPATSISALLVTYKLLGLNFTIFIFLAVILMGITTGFIGNFLTFKPRISTQESCPHCGVEIQGAHTCKKKINQRIKSILRFAYVDMVKDIGPETALGLILAALVASIFPLGILIRRYLSGGWGYLFSLIFGLAMYICSTGTVPLVDAFLRQGMNIGAGMVLLLVGPITSFGTVLVLRKEFGTRILLVYLGLISSLSLLLGYLFSLIYV